MKTNQSHTCPHCQEEARPVTAEGDITLWEKVEQAVAKAEGK